MTIDKPCVIFLMVLLAVIGGAIIQASTQNTPATVQERGTGDEASVSRDEILVDERGRKYRIIEYPKGREGATHLRRPNGRVRIRFGMELDILDETDDSFFLKVYLPAEPAPGISKPAPPPAPAAQPSEDGPAWPIVDRLTLLPFDDGLPRRGQWRDGFDIADMNGDGHLDIVFGPARKGRPLPNIFLGDGAGSWSRWQTTFPSLPYDYGDAAAADFNGDGHTDIALAMHLRGMAVLIGDGKGGFTSWSKGIGLSVPGHQQGGVAFSSRALETVDWDGDGRTDLVALGEGPTAIKQPAGDRALPAESRGLLVYRNRGDGTWERGGSSGAAFGHSLSLADFDSDGDVDAVASSMVHGDRAIFYRHNDDHGLQPELFEELRRQGFVFAVASSDLDNDGRADILVGSIHKDPPPQRTSVDAYYAGTDGTWERLTLWTTEGRAGVYGLAAGNLDGDARIDVAFGTGDGEFHVLLGAAGRSFVRELSPEIQTGQKGCHAYGLRFTDMDQAGAHELLTGFAGERVAMEPLYTSPGCPGDGSLRAWRAMPKQADTADTR